MIVAILFIFALVIAQAENRPSYQELLNRNEELFFQNIQLKNELDQLKRLVFGSRHERFVPAVSQDQLTLGISAPPLPQPSTTLESIQYERKKAISKSDDEKVSTGRMLLPASLPREQVIIEPTEDVSGWKKIGQEITEELERIPGKLFVRQYIRNKYVNPSGEAIVIGKLPVRPIEKGIAGPGLLAQIIIDKFVDHLPVYRQVQRFEREGMKLPISTLANWIGGTCQLLEPLYEVHRKKVLAMDYLQVDESPIRVLDKAKKGTTHRGYYWVYHAPLSRLVMFDYRQGRGREGPGECLRNFKGHLQTDGYSVYEDYDNLAGVTLIHCMAHARRKFDEALDNDKERASYVLTEMQKLYALEQSARDQSLSPEQLRELRGQQAVPVLENLKAWMIDAYSRVVPQSTIGKALSYSLQRWDKLSRYTEDGRLQIDNNLVENAIRPVAIGRKNYLFAGSHDGARRAAMLYSFMGTCKINNVNPFEWLKDILIRIPNHPVNKLEELLPNNWVKPVS
jgi:transposase